MGRIEDTLQQAKQSQEVSESTGDQADDILQLEEELARLGSEIESQQKIARRIADELKSLEPGEAKDLLNFTPEELAHWADLYHEDSPMSAPFRKLQETHAEWQVRLGRASDFEYALVASAQVVAATCVGMAAVRGIQDLDFDLCILDESSKATPTESLVPMSRARKWIIVGDSKQLPPFVEEGMRNQVVLDANGISDADLKRTLFDHLHEFLPAGSKATLSIQHRMVPDIGNLISECFYEGQLESAPIPRDLIFQNIFSRSVVWFTTATQQDRCENRVAYSFSNATEVHIISQLLRRMDVMAKSKGRKLSVISIVA